MGAGSSRWSPYPSRRSWAGRWARVRLLDRLRRALLGAEEDPLRREIEEMRRMARAAAREARIERRKPRRKSFELELFPEELVQKE